MKVRNMQTDVQVMYTQEELAKMEIQNFVNEGLKDVQNNDLYDADEVFDELEGRYKNAVIFCDTLNCDIGDIFHYVQTTKLRNNHSKTKHNNLERM